MDNINIAQVVEAAVRVYNDQTGTPELAAQIQSDLVTAFADPGMIFTVIINDPQVITQFDNGLRIISSLVL